MTKRCIALVVLLVLTGLVVKAEAEHSKAIPAMPSKQISFHEFFPVVNGSLAKLNLSIPSDYEKKQVPDDLVMNTFLWGRSIDLKAALADPSQVQFDKAAQSIFRIRFTKNVTFDSASEQFVDMNGSIVKGLQTMGISNPQTSFVSRSGIPILLIRGETEKGLVYMAYIHSPDDNLSVLISLQSSRRNPDLDEKVWKTFSSSFGE
jgi:hypothetical protein